jgi:hypothetical protein
MNPAENHNTTSAPKAPILSEDGRAGRRRATGTLQANDGVPEYYDKYLKYLVETPMDDGLLAVHLNQEIDGWERDGEAIGYPRWPEYVEALGGELAALRSKIAGQTH